MSPIVLDHNIFHFINSDIANPFFDRLMPLMTDLHKEPLFWLMTVTWIIIQIALPAALHKERFFEIARMRAKRWALGIVVLILALGLADFVTYRGIKIWVQRPRPEAVGLNPILRTHAHSGWSFPSNHSANNFALARTISVLAPPYAAAAYIFASSVAISRIYVGVHFPSDVLVGGILGWLIASLMLIIARRSGVLKTFES
jgi:membrane-associated phospholipid phosphatase